MPRLARLFACLVCLILTVPGGTDARAQDQGSLSLKGKLLVADPELRDPNFSATVVYLLNHDRRGAMGLVINRPLAEGPIGKLLDALGDHGPVPDPERPIRVFAGGPVGPDQVFVLHTDDDRRADTVLVEDGIAVTPSTELLDDVGAGRGPQQSLLAVGYAGWAPGQLERELSQGAWIVVEGDPALVFDSDTETKWERAFARRGVDL